MADLEPFHTEESESSACLGRCKRALEVCEEEFSVGDTCDKSYEGCVNDCDSGGFEMS